MRTRLHTESDAVSSRVRQLLQQFALARVAAEIADVRILVDAISDPFGKRLTRCRADIQLRNGNSVLVEEIQSSLELAVRRALERSVRTIQRRLATQRRPSRA